MIYKKNQFLIQALPVICFFTVIFYPGSCKITTDAHASDHIRNQGEKRSDEKSDNTRVKMEERSQLTKEEGEYLLSVARKTIEAKLFNNDISKEENIAAEKYLEKRGAFVTLTVNGNLRGCIGHIIPQESLIEGIRINAINAAFEDPRFPPLSKKEWDKVKVEISILTEPELLEYSGSDDLLGKLSPGVDGVILKKGYAQATFLPQVWDQLPDKAEFLTHLCMKAGMSGSEWKKGGLTVYTYQVQAFEEEH